MTKTSLTFRVQKGTSTLGAAASTIRTQTTPSGGKVVTVNRDVYSSALNAASNVMRGVKPSTPSLKR